MGKGSRNRLTHKAEPQKVQPKKKVKKYRRPLSRAAKTVIGSCVCVVMVLAIVFVSLSSAGTFKRANILIKSRNNTYDLNQQMATYLVWDALQYTGSYLWNYLSTDDKSALSAQGISSASDYALSYAMSGVQGSLLTSINGNADMLKEFVAVCDLGAEQGVTLSKDEKKQARDDIQEYFEDLAADLNISANAFIKYYIGSNVKMRDIKDAAELQAFYSKVMEKKEAEVEDSITDAILENYRDTNLATFYSTDYLVEATEDTELRDALLAATSVNAFKTVIATNNFNENYKSVFNKRGTSIHTQAEELLNALKNKTTADELNAALTEKELTAKEYTADEIKAISDSLKNWMFDASRVAYDSNTVSTKDAIYVVVLSTKPADNKVSAAMKAFTLDEGESYGEGDAADPAFKTNLLNTLLNNLELLDSTEGMKLYTDTEDETIKSMIADLETLMTKAIPAVKTQNYQAEPAADSFQDWMFDKDSVQSPVAAGATKEFSTTKDNVTTYSVYYIVEPMKYDTDPLVKGGYIKFEDNAGKEHETLAAEFLATLTGLTGDQLAAKFTSNVDAVTGSALDADSIKDADVKDWLFDPARVANEITSKTVANTAEEGKPDNSYTYVAYYLDSTPTWKNTAHSAYSNKELTDWVKGLITDYTLQGTKFIKDKVETKNEDTQTA